MTDIFGAIGTAISLLDLIFKRVKTYHDSRKMPKAQLLRYHNTQEVEWRTELLQNLYAELNGLKFQGSSMEVRCLEACEHENREL